MLFSYEELIGLDDDANDTASWLNTELDYYLCSNYGIVIDELDTIPIDKLRELRIYALFENQEALDEQTTDLELWIEEHINQSKGESIMKQFKVSVGWEVYATAYIEADNLKQAIEIANEDEFPLPTESHYIDGSFKVDMQSTIALNELHTAYDIIDRGYNLEPIHCVHCGSTEVTFNQKLMNGICGDCGQNQIKEW